jgi:hypothetical protein
VTFGQRLAKSSANVSSVLPLLSVAEIQRALNGVCNYIPKSLAIRLNVWCVAGSRRCDFTDAIPKSVASGWLPNTAECLLRVYNAKHLPFVAMRPVAHAVA